MSKKFKIIVSILTFSFVFLAGPGYAKDYVAQGLDYLPRGENTKVIQDALHKIEYDLNRDGSIQNTLNRLHKNPVKKVDLYFITSKLYLREEASIDSKILHTMPEGELLDVISRSGDWYKVKYKGKIGYSNASQVQKAWGYKVDETLIVNKAYRLSNNFNPGVNPEARKHLDKLREDASKEGLNINIVSDFRSYQHQNSLYDRYAKRDGTKASDTYSARPGHSEHQTGLTFDLGGADSRHHLRKSFEGTKEGEWLYENCHEYGFILRYPKGKETTGYQYEPWHFRYVGEDLAREIKSSGLTLDEYFNAVSPNY